MRKVLLFCVVFLGYINSYSQQLLNTDGLNNTNNVYLQALKEYCSELDSSKVKIVYVRRDHFIGEIWPKQINGLRIEYLEVQEDYLNGIKHQGESATIVGIGPFNFSKGEFYVSVIPFAARYKKKHLTMSNGGGMTVYFKYNAQNKGFVFEHKRWVGI